MRKNNDTPPADLWRNAIGCGHVVTELRRYTARWLYALSTTTNVYYLSFTEKLVRRKVSNLRVKKI